MHVCPLVDVLIPHVGGPVVGPGAPTVILEGLPAACMGDMMVCVGPPDDIVLGFPTVLAEGRPIAVVGMSLGAHGSDVIGPGAVTVEIG